ncbi:NAD(P)H-binding protein [Nocardia cyriacigeorgica]|uniref:NmrA family NAD(P)-binding protein n=1 Tax=Nocardia cyriacigeorgica TaxID=135487 RepID=UPI0024538E58|nr:NAD(P)H-binding protein [Nocardia cyriacigeorgica]
MSIVVFGASGNVGREVVAGLNSVAVKVRLTSRAPDAARLPAGAEVVVADLDRSETLPAALEGADSVFVYARPAGLDGFVAAAEAFLRPGMFATNLIWWWQKSIREHDLVHLPYPDARIAAVHEKDIAAMAVTALTTPGHRQATYPVTGPEAITMREQVRHIAAAVGRDIAVVETSVDQARAALERTVAPVVATAILDGWRAATESTPPVSTSVEDVTGRPAQSFAEWARDHAADFVRR